MRMMSTVVETQIIPAVIPYYKERDSFPANILNLIYRRLVMEGLDRILMHNRATSEEEFVEFAGSQALTSLFLDQANGRYAGLAWLTNVEECDSLSKGIGAFCFFKEYWSPEITQAFGEICLSQWFNVLNLTIVYGITPKPNRTAQRYCKRLGFEYVATVPNFVSFLGETTDALICTLTRDAFNSAHGG